MVISEYFSSASGAGVVFACPVGAVHEPLCSLSHHVVACACVLFAEAALAVDIARDCIAGPRGGHCDSHTNGGPRRQRSK